MGGDKAASESLKMCSFPGICQAIGRECEQSFGRGGVSKSQWAVREHLVALPAVAKVGALEVAHKKWRHG